MKKLYRVTLIGLLTALSVTSYAADNGFPKGCRPTGFTFKNYTLLLQPEAEGRAQSIYFIYNKSNTIVKFFQSRQDDDPIRMHLNNGLKPDRWAVFAANNELTKFICAIPSSRSTHGQVVDCKKYIELCEYTNAKFGDNGYGNYWMVTDQSRTNAQRYVVKQGVLLKS